MGVLTDDLSRLHNEILMLRKGRRHLLTEIGCQTRGRKSAMSTVCSRLARERREMVRRSMAERSAFLSSLRSTIAARQRELRVDLAAARGAWADLGTPMSSFVEPHKALRVGWETVTRAKEHFGSEEPEVEQGRAADRPGAETKGREAEPARQHANKPKTHKRER